MKLGVTASAIFVGLLLVYLALWAATALGAAPANDSFASPQVLSGNLPIEVEGSNVGATKEAGESIGTTAAGHSVWFEWEATSTGFVTIGSCEAEFRAMVGIFVGTAIDSLTKVASTNSSEGPRCPGSQSEFTFRASAGTSYKIAVDGNAFYLPPTEPPATEGKFRLRIEARPPPVNDDFPNATTLEGTTTEEAGGERFYYASAFGNNWGATKETGEPNHDGDTGGASVWYQWTAPGSGTAHVSACCEEPSLLGVYVGNAVSALSTVGEGDGFTMFPVSAGTTYRIAVDGKNVAGVAATGSFTLRVSMALAPPPPSEEDRSPSGSSVSPPPQITNPPETKLFKRVLKRRPPIFVFTFQSTEPGSEFRCRLDSHPFAACSSPVSYKHLKPGGHTFAVVAVNASGVEGPTPAMARFRSPKDVRQRRSLN